MYGKPSTSRTDRWLAATLQLFTTITVLLLITIVGFLCLESWQLISGSGQNTGIFALLSGQDWYPLEGKFGMGPMILASLAVTFGAICLALPIGLACAICLQFYASRGIARWFELALILLAGIPSVIFGLWGLTRLVPIIGSWQPPGASMLAAILVLALMICPTVALTTTAALRALPLSLTAGSEALGLRLPTQIIQVYLPAARSGIISGVLLATARALGETMAVLMVAGNVVQNPSDLFSPVRVLTANIALEMAYAMGDHRGSLFASGLLLTALVWILSLWANRASGQRLLRAPYV